MKKLTKVSVTVVAVSSVLILVGPLTAYALTAAVAPNLGTSATFSVLGGGAMTSADSTTISGDLGSVIAKTGVWVIGGTNYSAAIPAGVSTAASDAYISMNRTTQAGGTTWDPASPPDMTPLPGLYKADSNPTITTELHLNGDASSVWIFQIEDSLTFASGATVTLGPGVSACNVYWYIKSSATITGASGKKFVGTLIANSSVTLNDVIVTGRMMALTGTLSTTGTTIITNPTCVTVAASVGSVQDGTITVVKTVVNDSGGTKKVADFPLFVNGIANGHQPVISGETNTFFTFGLYPYTVTETSDPNYTATFSGDCDANGFLNLAPGDHKVCLITNNDKGAPVVPPVPPLIDVVKTASPLALPNGPGPVTYTYTLHNMGTVPVTDITMVGDTCSPIVLSSGDTNGDHKLDVSETWVFHCTTTLSATHTNTVVATGWANGISAVDIASATVVVGLPVVPPIIHVTKVPSVFTLPAPGGAVTYSYTVTNPGTAPLSDVSITDNKCTGLPGRVVGHPGDLNKNNLLDPGETWQFTCKSNLTQTTTNIGTAAGSANGLTARDFAIATVVVASPALPSTGLPPRSRTPWDIFITAWILMVVSSSLVIALRKR